MTPQTMLLLLLGGLAAGTVGSMLGIGGGLIVIPLLTSFYAFSFEEARATSLLAVIATSCGVAVAAGRERFVNVRLGIVLAVPTACVAFANAFLSRRIDASILFALFALVLLGTGVLMWRRRDGIPDAATEIEGEEVGALDGSYFDPRAGARVTYRVRRIPGVLGLSAVAGAMSGLLGIGGGVFQVPAMNVLAGVPMRAATATSNFILGITAASTLPIYFGRGHVRPLESAAVILGVLFGALLGSNVAQRLQGSTLRRLFSVLLLLLAIQMVHKAVKSW